MKKLLAIFTAVMLVSCATNHDEVVVSMKQNATTKISKEQALKNLYSELKFIDEGTRAEGTQREVKSIKPLVGAVTRSGNALDNNLLYIVEFGEGQGSAVVAADTRLKPVIAVLDTDVLTAEDFANDDMEDISAYMASMIEDYAISVASANSVGLLPAPGHTVVDTIYNVNVPPMLKTKWSQGSPYNDLCVKADGSSVSAGCGAIAIGQFLYYHRCPDVINGYTVSWSLLEDCEYKAKQIGEIIDGGHIGGGTIIGGGISVLDPTIFSKREVAKFIYNIGCSIGINYSSGYAGSSTTIMLNYLRMVGFDCTYDEYSCEDIKEIVQNNKPVIMTGRTTSNKGHAWIVDGWKDYLIRTTTASEVEGPVDSVTPEYTITNEYFDRIHCNFGWGGHCDGYYIGDIFDCRIVNNYIEPGIGDVPDSGSGDDYKYDLTLKMYSY